MTAPSAPDRYQSMSYARCGNSGLVLPRIALGLWHNFGAQDDASRARELVRHAFDLGITHFDLANNYGPPPGSAETLFGRILREELSAHRDELVISTKAGYRMWPGPYGDGGSRKYLISSLDQSLARMGLDYVDIFYHHRPDVDTPLEETVRALEQMVGSGKALYVGLSNYDAEQTRRALDWTRQLGLPCIVHQPQYSMLNRGVEGRLLPDLAAEGVGCVVFSPLAQGRLTSRYLDGIPSDSRAAKQHAAFLKREDIDETLLTKLRRLNEIAKRRQQSLAQLALAWVLRWPAVTTALIGASRTQQLDDCVGALAQLELSSSELQAIEDALA